MIKKNIFRLKISDIIIGNSLHVLPFHRFNTFHLEASSACNFDYVAVYDGQNTLAPLLGRFCGAVIPPDLRSSTNHLFLVFVTDSSVDGVGWRATYSQTLGRLMLLKEDGAFYVHIATNQDTLNSYYQVIVCLLGESSQQLSADTLYDSRSSQVCFWITCRSSTGMWWLPVDAHGHVWFSRSKPRWALWTQHGLPVDYWDASQQGYQPDLHLVRFGECHWLPLWLCQCKEPPATEITVLIGKNILNFLQLDISLCCSITESNTVTTIEFFFLLMSVCVCLCLSGVWWRKRSFPSGWDILWKLHSCFFYICWKLPYNSLCQWQRSTASRLQCYLQICAM